MTLTQAFEEACARAAGRDIAQVTARDRILVVIWGIEAEVNNGGFDQYYFNGAGEHARFVPAALHEIGAHKMAQIVERANALFRPDGPPVDGDEREDALFKITDDIEGAWDQLDREFQAYPDDIAALLVKHFGLDSAA